MHLHENIDHYVQNLYQTSQMVLESTDQSLNMMNNASEGPKIKIRTRQHHPHRTLSQLGDQGTAPRRMRLNLGHEERRLMYTGNEAVQVAVSEAMLICLAFLIFFLLITMFCAGRR